MLRVGLTGGVGSGKSAAAAMLQEMGARLSQSDEVGRALMQPGQAAFAGIVAAFGLTVLLPNGTLDRKALARIAFGEGRVEEINAIVHPLVLAEQQRWADAVALDDPAAVAVVESALIFETKHSVPGAVEAPWRTRFDRIVVVVAPLDLRRDRYIQRLGVSDPAAVAAAAEDFARRAAAQWPDAEKAALADFVVENDGTMDALRDQIRRLWILLRQESADRAAEAM